MPPACLDTPCVWMPHTFGGIQTYRAQPNIWRTSKHTERCPNRGASKHMGHPNIQGLFKHIEAYIHMGAFKHTGVHPNIWQHLNIQGHPNVWVHMDTPSLTKHAFFVLCIYIWGIQIYSGCIQTYGVSKHTRGIQTYGSSKHTGECPNIWDVQPYRGHPNIWGCPNIQGGIWGESNDTGSHPNMRCIQTYGASNIQGASKHMEASKCMGAYGHPLSLTNHAFFVLCMYRGHPNIFCIILTYICHLEFRPSWFFFLILNILSIFQNILLGFALFVLKL